MRRGVANGVKRTAAMDSRREVAGPRRSSQNRSIGERRVPPTSDRRRAVLSVGTPRTQGGPRRVAQRKAWTQTEPNGGTTQAEITRLRTVVAELSAETLQLKKGLWP